MYQSGFSVSTLNSIRSSLSFFCPKELNIGENHIILRLFKAFYRKRPSQPKYLVFWPVEKLLDLLASWHPPNTLDLKHLTLKTLALISLTSSDRGQTIHAMNIESVHIDKDNVTFVIFDRLKTSKRFPKPKTVKCVSSKLPSLNVCDYVLCYLNRTLCFRAKAVREGLKKPVQLFLSWKTKAPVSRKTLSRWLTTTLTLADIDVEKFQAHSFRGAGLSAAKDRGATMKMILSAGDWTNVKTFKNFYDNPSSNSAVGRMILEHYEVCLMNV